jgi:transcriptional regulator with XRE-family HTH domain
MRMKNKLTLGQKLQECLNESELTKADLARAMEVRPQSVQSWLKTSRVSKDKLPQLTILFNKPLSYWLNADEESLLTDLERQMLRLFRDLPADLQDKALQDVNFLHNLNEPKKAQPIHFAVKKPKFRKK